MLEATVQFTNMLLGIIDAKHRMHHRQQIGAGIVCCQRIVAIDAADGDPRQAETSRMSQ